MANATPNQQSQMPDPTAALTAYQQQMQHQNAMLAGLMGKNNTSMPALPNSLPPSFSGKATPTPSWLDILQARGALIGNPGQVDPGVTYGDLKLI